MSTRIVAAVIAAAALSLTACAVPTEAAKVVPEGRPK